MRTLSAPPNRHARRRIEADARKGEALLARARQAVADGEVSEASRLIRELERLDVVCRDVPQLKCYSATLRGDHDAAVSEARRLVRSRPGDWWSYSMLAESLLRRGDYPEGFHAYSEGQRRRRLEGCAPCPLPEWDGGPVEGDLLVVGDLGLGDQVMFGRLIPLITERLGRPPLVAANPRLAAPLSRALGFPILTHFDTPPTSATRWVTLSSVPAILGTTAATVPPPLALAPPPEPAVRRGAAMGAHIPPGAFRVGLAWSGSRQAQGKEASLVVGKATRRPWPLRSAKPLAEVPGVALVSLQAGDGADEVHKVPFPMFGPGDAESVDDTLALIEALDLVITLDSFVAHLAASAGVETWVALPTLADWRWGTGDRTPWYPSARLWRQPRPGDWGSVFRTMADELATVVEQG